MLLRDPKTDVVLRLLDGRSEQREIVLEGGRAAAPFAVGSQAAWSVGAAHVASAHVMLAFNGARLFACALRGEMALLDGTPLDGRWAEVAMPSELRFGSARVSIGRRAGPDEPTEAPVLARRFFCDDAVTCFDEERLQAALRLSVADPDVTRIADVELPAAARGPSNDDTTAPPLPPALPPPSLARPVKRTVRLVRKQVLQPMSAGTRGHAPGDEQAPRSPSGAMTARLLAGLDPDVPPSMGVPSSMPLTIPSEGLVHAAPAFMPPSPGAFARPSSPTMAIPEPAGRHVSELAVLTPQPRIVDSLHMAALAVSGERPPAIPNGAGPSALDRSLGELGAGWKQASLPKKAIAILMVPALLGALLTLRPAATPPPPQAPATAATTQANIVGAPHATDSVPVPVASAGHVEPTAPATPAAQAGSGPAPASDATPSDRPRPAVGGPRDARTAERRALDTVASGLDAPAAEQYEALAAAHPDNVAFREAGRILRARSATRHD